MMEKLLEIEVTEHGTVLEEVEPICTMTGFRRRFLIHHIGEGFSAPCSCLLDNGKEER